ncbi:SEC-C metal-binding domain-containing protein [Micromonospora endophytica]
MFTTMMDGIKEETVGFLYNLEVQVNEPEPEAEEVQLLEKPVEIKAKGLRRAPQQQGLQYSAPTIDGEAGAGGVAVQRDDQRAPALGIGGPEPSAPAAPGRTAPAAPQRAAGGLRGPGVAASTARQTDSSGQASASNGPSRNAPCPCGSGRKYKRCHGAPGGTSAD